MDSQPPNRLSEVLNALANRRDDAQSWTEFYRLLKPYVYSVCIRLLGPYSNLADDACQEVFLKIVRFGPLSQLAVSGKIYQYVRMVVRSVCIDAHQDGKLHEPFWASVSNEPQSRDPHYEYGILLDQLGKCLSKDETELLRLLTLGVTVGEIAQNFGLNYGTAATRVHRLRMKVKRLCVS